MEKKNLNGNMRFAIAKVEKDRRIRAAFSRPWNVEKKRKKILKKGKKERKKSKNVIKIRDSAIASIPPFTLVP